MDGDHEKLRHGLLRIAGSSIDPADRKWDIVGMHVSSSNCACGASIMRCYVLRDQEMDTHITVGSTCIEHLRVSGVILTASAWDSLLGLRGNDGDEHSLNNDALDAVERYGILHESLVQWYRPLMNKRAVFKNRQDVADLRYILNKVILAHFDEAARRVRLGDYAPFRVGFDFPPTKLYVVDANWVPTWEPSVPPAGASLCVLRENVFATHYGSMCKCKPPTIPLATTNRWGKVLYKCAECKYSSSTKPGPAREDATCCDCAELTQVVATTGPHGTFYVCRNMPNGCGFISYSPRGPRIMGQQGLCKCNPPLTSRVFMWHEQPYHGCKNFVSKTNRGCGLFQPDRVNDLPPRKKIRRSKKY